ncbi:UDP-3-O-[3-hydroxymyristoyl] N-acetylglucosamine deacetylase, partial [Achromobacter xylosoxidans]
SGHLYLRATPRGARFGASKAAQGLNTPRARARRAPRDAWELVSYESQAEAPQAFRHEWQLA